MFESLIGSVGKFYLYDFVVPQGWMGEADGDGGRGWAENECDRRSEISILRMFASAFTRFSKSPLSRGLTIQRVKGLTNICLFEELELPEFHTAFNVAFGKGF